VLIVGLAPGMRGANRTGRPFTGDYAGDCSTDLLKFGFARHLSRRPNDGCISSIAASPMPCAACRRKQAAAVEFTNCRPFLQAELAVMPISRSSWPWQGAHDQILRA